MIIANEAATQNFVYRQGETFSHTITVIDDTNTPVDLTGWEIQFSGATSLNTPPIFAQSIEGSSEGVINIVQDLPAAGSRVYYDLRLKDPDGVQRVYLEGQIKLTKSISSPIE